MVDLHVGHLGGRGSGSSCSLGCGWAGIVDLHVGLVGEAGRMDLHFGHLDLSCWTLGREAGMVDLTLGREAGIVDLHVGHLGGRLG